MSHKKKWRNRKWLKTQAASAEVRKPVEPVIKHAVLGCCGLAGIAMLSAMTKQQLDNLEAEAARHGEGAVMAVIVEQAIEGNAGWHGSQAHVVPLLQGNGWVRQVTFFNPNSGNTLGLWAKVLPEQERRAAIGWADAPTMGNNIPVQQAES